MKRICAHCKSHFRPSKYHRHQHYCNKEECQKARKALWQKDKIQKDPSYKANHYIVDMHFRSGEKHSNHGNDAKEAVVAMQHGYAGR